MRKLVFLAVVLNAATASSGSASWSLTAASGEGYISGSSENSTLSDGRAFFAALGRGLLYNPGTASWRSTQSTPDDTAYWYVPLNSTVLFPGGPGRDQFILYNADSDTWTPPRTMLSSHYNPNIVSLTDGRALVIGEGDVAEAYDLASDSWRLIAPLTTPRRGTSAITLYNGTVLVSGGWWGTSVFDSAEIYDPNFRPMETGREYVHSPFWSSQCSFTKRTGSRC